MWTGSKVNVDRLGGNVDRLGVNVDRLGGNVDKLGGNVDKPGGNVRNLGVIVRRLGGNVDGGGPIVARVGGDVTRDFPFHESIKASGHRSARLRPDERPPRHGISLRIDRNEPFDATHRPADHREFAIDRE